MFRRCQTSASFSPKVKYGTLEKENRKECSWGGWCSDDVLGQVGWEQTMMNSTDATINKLTFMQLFEFTISQIFHSWLFELSINEFSNIRYKDEGLKGADDDDLSVLAAGSAVREVKLRSEK